MTNYPLNQTYNETMRQLQTTDKVHADTFNPMFSQLINNDSYLHSSLADLATNIKQYSTFVAGSVNTYNVNVQNFNTAMASNQGRFLIPEGTFIINQPLIVPYGVSLIGLGLSSLIQADFSKWVGTDYRAIIIRGREGQTFNNLFNPYIGGFNVEGLNNSGLVSTGIFVGTDQSIASTNAVNYAYISGVIENIFVGQFDTAYQIKEVWNSQLNNLCSINCREGIHLVGKTVNVGILCNLTNFTNSYTSSTSHTIGITIDSKLDYTDGEGRPEGITVKPGSLIFGAYNNFSLQRSLYLTISKTVIDGATGNAIEINNPDSVTIDGCYLFSTGASNCCINFAASASQSKIIIKDNTFMTDNTSNNAMSSMAGARYGMEITSNTFREFLTPITINYLNDSVIKNNFGNNNRGLFIYVQSDCHNTEIDGNITEDNYPVLQLQPSTDKTVKIGYNKSGNNVTYLKGYVTMAANTTTIALPEMLWASAEYYIRSIIKVSPVGNLGNVWVTPEIPGQAAVINCSTAPAAATKIYYEMTAIPYSATT